MRSLVVFVACGIAACGTLPEVPPDHGPGPPPFMPPNIAFVHGVVETAAGVAVPMADVWISWARAAGAQHEARCILVPLARAVRVRADGRGYFSATLEGAVGPEYVGCVDILASDDTERPPSAFRDRRTRFRTAAANGMPRDTLRVQIRLR